MISSTSRHASPDSPSWQNLPRPYIPSIDATSCASSAASFGSAGAAIVSAFFRTVSWRRSASDTVAASYCVACLEKFVAAVMYASLARAEIASVSGVM